MKRMFFADYVLFNFPPGGLTAIGKVTLESDAQMSETLNWSHVCYYPDGSGGLLLHLVPPGTYCIIGCTEEYLIEPLEAEHWKPWVETPSIKIALD